MEYDAILIGSNGLGSGDSELGGKILGNFLRLLGERDDKPGYILLWNSGVKIAAEGSECLPHLFELEAHGVTILLCQTCVEFFGLAGQIAAGKVTGMPQIQDILFTRKVLTV